MTVMEQEITLYVERVRAALADLPPTLRDELTEDLPEHLAEVAAETAGPLVDRLGTPEAYAAELRAAAGVGVRTPKLDQRVAGVVSGLRTRLAGVDTRLGPLLGYASASEFLRLLRPGWWLLRAYLAAMAVSVFTTGGTLGLLPRFGGSGTLGLLLLVACVLASLWLGRNVGRLGTWPRRALHAGSAVLVFFGLVGLANLDDRMRWGDYGYQSVSVDNQYAHIRDVFVYDGEGRLVENARLFDQNGSPIRLGYPDCPDLFSGNGDPMQRAYPYCPAQAPFQLRSPTARPSTAAPPTGSVPSTSPSPPASPSPAPVQPTPTG